MAASLWACRHHDGRAAFHAFDFALEDPKLRRIDQIVGEVHREKRRTNAFEPGRRVVIPGRADLVEHVVRILLTQRMWDSAGGPRVFHDFWTLAYAAIDD